MASRSRCLVRRRLAAVLLLSASTLVSALPGLSDAAPEPAAPAPDANRVYEEVRLTLPTREDALRLLREVPEIEFLKPEPGQTGTYRAVSRPDLDAKIEALGYQVEVLVPDLVSAFESSATAGPGFGVFHTYSETEAYLDSIAAVFPAITTEKFSIGNTLQGRTIWAIKVSDNPDVDEDEGEVLFDGVIHAREIMTVEMCLHYLNYLCSNYGTDDIATFLVDNREIFFVPIINADGFVYNEQTNPNGGGMWRKNRNPNFGGCIGVDNNRNYSVGWGGINGDPDPCSEQYRGTAPNSEPENQVMEAFIDSRNFVTHQALHSFAELILLPWGYDHTIHTPDDSLLRVIGQEMARDSGYLVGQAGEVLYNAAGNAFDWSYGETTNHDKIFAYTIEIGGSGFWPQASEAPGLLAENLHAHIYLTQIAGAYLSIAGSAVSGGNGNGRFDPGESGDLSLSVKNTGLLVGLDDVTVTLATSDPYIYLIEAGKSLGSIGAGQTKSMAADPFSLFVDAACPQGHDAEFTVTLRGSGGYVTTETLSLTIGSAPAYYVQDFETGTDWTQDPSHTATTGAFIRIDPNPTAFQPGNDATPDPGVLALITGQNSSDGVDDVDNGISATRSPVLDLASVGSAHLSMQYFHGQRDNGGDPAGDFFRISLSNDGGTTYPVNLVSFGDAAHAPTWTALEADLESFLPLTNAMRIRVQASDGVAVGDIIEGGVDDVRVENAGSGNQAPSAPVAVSPTGGAVVGPTPVLVVSNAIDPESDPLTYSFRVYADTLLTTIVASADDVVEGSGTTAWTVSPPLIPGAYMWRAYAQDAEDRSLYSSAAGFSAQGATGVGQPASGAATGAVALTSLGPNPSRGATRLAFNLPQAGRVFVAVVNTEGRVVRILENGWRDAGRHEATWDGRDAAGREVASGAYLLRLEAGSERRTERVTLVR